MWESRVLRRAFERLELHEGKLSRAVLRGGGGGDVTSLPDTWVGDHPGLPGPDYAPFACKHRLKHRNRAPGQQGLRAGANLLGCNLDGNQIARKYRTCAGHADLLFRDGGKRQAGKCDCLLEFTSRPELSLRAAHESGHNSMCQNGLKVLLRVTVRTKKRDSSAISSGVAALKSAESTPVIGESGTGPKLAPPTSERSSPGRGILISAHLSRATRGTIGRL